MLQSSFLDHTTLDVFYSSHNYKSIGINFLYFLIQFTYLKTGNNSVNNIFLFGVPLLTLP
jgi:hypothetical protein